MADISFGEKYKAIFDFIKDNGIEALKDKFKTGALGSEEYIINYRELKDIHHTLVTEAEQLYQLCRKENNPPFLVRAYCKEIISIIEADLFILNLLHPYPDYNDRAPFVGRFKMTFKFYAKDANVNNEGLQHFQQQYFSTYFEKLRLLSKQRDQFVHPKNIESLSIKIDLDEARDVLNSYDRLYQKTFGTL